LIRQTLQANAHVTENQDITVIEHQWGKFSKREEDSSGSSIERCVKEGSIQFDLIVGSDVAYHEDLYDILIASMRQFSHDNTLALIGVTRKDTKPGFFTKLEEAGFLYERLADHLLPVEYRGPIFGLFAVRRNI